MVSWGVVHNVTSRGQSALSMIVAAACGGGSEDSKELCSFPTVTSEGKMLDEARVS